MSEVLDEFNFGPKYPWPQWMDGQIRRITKGEDFDIDTEKMRITLYRGAISEGVRVRAKKVNETQIVFQAYGGVLRAREIEEDLERFPVLVNGATA